MAVKTVRAILVTFLLCGSAISVAGQSASKSELLIQETIYLPAAGCDNGVAVPNFALPKVVGTTAKCITAQHNAVLPSIDDSIPRDKLTTEVGTILLIGISHDQVILAADSRSGIYDSAQKFKGVFDRRCKVIALTPRLLFAASGLTRTRATIPSKIDYDAQEVAQSVTRNFVFDPSWMKPNETIKEIAASWAWELAFRIRRGLARGTLKPPSFPTWITGVFAGLEPNGEISVAIAKLEYNRVLPNMNVPAVSIVVHIPLPPKDFTWLEGFGHKEIAETYYSARRKSEATHSEYEQIRA